MPSRISATVSLIILLISLCLESDDSVMGQSATRLEPIVSYMNPVPIEGIGSPLWSINSQKLIFADIALLPTDEWYEYDLNTKEITFRNYYPLQPQLSETESQTLVNTASAQAVEIEPISRSITHRFLVYGVLTGEQLETNWGPFQAVQPGIFDIRQKSVFTISTSKLYGIPQVFWSADETAFVATNTIVPPIWINVSYVSNYFEDVSKAMVREVNGIWIGDQSYAVNAAYDISADGNRVLLRLNAPTTETTYKLYIYNARFPNQDRFLNEFDATEVIAASFAPNDESKLWLFSENGVMQYDLTTGEQTVLNNAITSIDALNVSIDNPAVFSPNGHYLATLGENGLYLLDLTQYIPQSTPSTAEATMQSQGLERLWITVDCPIKISDKITWHIFNPNPESVTATWQSRVFGGGGTIKIPGGNIDAPGEASFVTETAPPNNTDTVDIFVDGVFHDTKKLYCDDAQSLIPLVKSCTQ